MSVPARHTRRPWVAGPLFASFLTASLAIAAPASAAADPPPQEPGITPRVYDVDKLLPAIDWTTPAERTCHRTAKVWKDDPRC